MRKIGLVDFDTSHVVQFTKRLNHLDIEEDQWVDGGNIVIGVPGGVARLAGTDTGLYGRAQRNGRADSCQSG